MKVKVVTYNEKHLELDIEKQFCSVEDLTKYFEEKYGVDLHKIRVFCDGVILQCYEIIKPEKKYYVSLYNDEQDKLFQNRPEVSVNVVITEGEMAGKSVLIKGITDKTSVETFIKKVSEGFGLKNVLISLYFPVDIIINAWIYKFTEIYTGNNPFSMYSLCQGGKRSIGMIVIPFEAMNFDLTMNVKYSEKITLKNIKGFEKVSDLIKKIEKEIKSKEKYLSIKYEGFVYGEEDNVIDIISDNHAKDILSNNNFYDYHFISDVHLLEDYVQEIRLIVKSLTGKKLTIFMDLSSDITSLKKRIEEREGIPIEVQRLIYAGKQLEDHRSLSDYNIQEDATFHLLLRLKGGGCSFVDVSKLNALKQTSFSDDAPGWRICGNGANVEGKCLNKNCVAYDKNVIVRLGMGRFDILDTTKYHCPCCNCYVTVIKPSFCNCRWKINYVKSDGVEGDTGWRKIGDKYETYDEDKAGMAEYSTLIIQAESLDKASSSDECMHFCCICHKPFLSKEEEKNNKDMEMITLKCKHQTHKQCLKRWCDHLKSSSDVNCPLCNHSAGAA